jgi:hypothetical protein
MAAIAQSADKALPRALKSALGLPADLPSGKKGGKKRARAKIERMMSLAAPYDNGPLALAAIFVEARRKEWTEKGPDGQAVWVADRLRNELFQLITGDGQANQKRLSESVPPKETSYSPLAEELDTPLVNTPRKTLRDAAVRGDTRLRIHALRALASVSTTPVAGDLGAASAAVQAEDPRLRLEGARTFLLLISRTRR